MSSRNTRKQRKQTHIRMSRSILKQLEVSPEREFSELTTCTCYLLFCGQFWTQTYSSTHGLVYTVHIYMDTWTRSYIHVNVHVWVHLHVRTWTHTCTFSHTCTWACGVYTDGLWLGLSQFEFCGTKCLSSLVRPLKCYFRLIMQLIIIVMISFQLIWALHQKMK